MSPTPSGASAPVTHDGNRAVAALTGTTYWLSGALALVAIVAGVGTLVIPDVLRGPAVMNGSARGTALVVLAIAIPALLISMVETFRGSIRSIVVWLGAATYLLYNSFLFLFLTPFNPLFLCYVAMLSLSLWSIGALLRQNDVGAFARRFSERFPARGIAIYALAIVVLNALAWLRVVIPALLSKESPTFLDGTGMPTNIIYIQDLGLWLPLSAAAAIWLYQRKPWGHLIIGAVLTMWVIESLSIAVDQWFGHQADPPSPVASATFTPIFMLVAVIGLIPFYFYCRNLD